MKVRRYTYEDYAEKISSYLFLNESVGHINHRLVRKLIEMMRKGEVRFSYLRKDGKRRSAIGTLKPDIVKKHIKGTGKKKPPYVLPYIDLDANGTGNPHAKADYFKAAWRSFRKKNLQTMKLDSM